MDNNYNNDPNRYGGQNSGNYPDNNGQYGNVSDFYSQMNNPYNQQYEQPDGKAIASLVLGLCNLLGWCLPIIGIPCGIVGLVLGIKGLKSSKRGMAIAGVVLCSITLALTLLNSVLGVIGALRSYT